LADRGFVIDLPIRERWQVVDVLRTAVYQCLAVVFDVESFAEVVSMVVRGAGGERAQARRLGARGEEPRGAEARLRIHGAPAGVQVEVTNPLPLGADPQVLFAMLGADSVQPPPPPKDAYVERLREVARDVTVRGGLGLMRIAYEASASITAAVADDRLTVPRLPGRAAARGDRERAGPLTPWRPSDVAEQHQGDVVVLLGGEAAHLLQQPSRVISSGRVASCSKDSTSRSWPYISPPSEVASVTPSVNSSITSPWPMGTARSSTMPPCPSPCRSSSRW